MCTSALHSERAAFTSLSTDWNVARRHTHSHTCAIARNTRSMSLCAPLAFLVPLRLVVLLLLLLLLPLVLLLLLLDSFSPNERRSFSAESTASTAPHCSEELVRTLACVTWHCAIARRIETQIASEERFASFAIAFRISVDSNNCCSGYKALKKTKREWMSEWMEEEQQLCGSEEKEEKERKKERAS